MSQRKMMFKQSAWPDPGLKYALLTLKISSYLSEKLANFS